MMYILICFFFIVQFNLFTQDRSHVNLYNPIYSVEELLSIPTVTPELAYVPTYETEEKFRDAVNLYYEGHIELAIEYHKENIDKYPLFIDSYLELAALQKEMSDMHGATETYRKLYLQVAPDNESYKERYFISAVQSFNHVEAYSLLPMSEENSEVLFYLGVLYHDSKRYNEALSYFDKALAINEYMAEAAYYKGLIYYNKRRYNEAVASFEQCLKIEPNFTMAFYDLALSYEKTKNNAKALANINKARSNLGSSKKIKDALRRIESKAPKVDSSKARKKQIARKDAKMPPLATTFSNTPKDEMVMVRIGIVEKAKQLSIKTSGVYTLDDGINKYRGKEGDLFFVKRQKEDLVIINKENKELFRSAKDINFSYNDPSFTTTVFDIMNGAGYFFAGLVDRTYRGSFTFLNRTAGITLVNTLEMEEYLYSVVPSEMPASWPMEALKAQAVAARSFTIATMGTYTSRGFDLYGSVVSHAYTGIKSEHARTTEAVNATKNLVIYDNTSDELNKVMITYYSANHGGYSEKGDVVWNNKRGSEHEAVPDKNIEPHKEPIPLYKLMEWLKDRPMTHSSWNKYHFAPAFRSSMMVSNYEMSTRVAKSLNIGEIVSIIPRKRGISGRVAVADAVGIDNFVQIEGDLIRGRLGGLRTNLFTMEPKLDKKGRVEFFMIRSAGWGHGVGMDQSGAAGMAADDYTYTEILPFYFPNGRIGKYPAKDND